MMKIGFFTNSYLPINYGVEISIETFRKRLENLGHEVFIFAPYYPGYTDKNPHVFRFKAIKVLRKKEVYFSFPFLPKNHRLKEIANLKLDIIHAHSPFGMGLFAKYLSWRQKIPLVYTHHVQYAEYAKLHFKKRLIPPIFPKAWSAWFSNLSDLVIAPSLKIERLLKKSGVNKEIVVLPTGIDTRKFQKMIKNKEILKKKLNISPQTKILLFVGRLELEKNPIFLIKAFYEILKKRKDVILLMIGSGSLVKKIKKEIKKLEIGNSVKFIGRIPHQEIPFYYQGSDIFIFSSFTETQGIIILEAEACGLPVVILKDDAFLGIVKNGENGFLVKENSPKIFAKYVLRILGNPQLYQKLSLASQETAKSFSEEKQAKRLLEIYKSLVK